MGHNAPARAGDSYQKAEDFTFFRLVFLQIKPSLFPFLFSVSARWENDMGSRDKPVCARLCGKFRGSSSVSLLITRSALTVSRLNRVESSPANTRWCWQRWAETLRYNSPSRRSARRTGRWTLPTPSARGLRANTQNKI